MALTQGGVMTGDEDQQRPEVERLMERVAHLPASRNREPNPEVDQLLLEAIARMAMGIDERLAQIQSETVSMAQAVVTAMRAALPVFRAMLAKLSEPQRASQPTDASGDTGQPGSLAELVHGTHQDAGLTRTHVGPSGHSQFVEPLDRVEAHPYLLVPGDVVARLHEYPRGYDPRLYLGRISHPYLPDMETLLWWTDQGPAITPRVDRMQAIGYVLPSTDAERQTRLQRWTEAID